VNVLALYDIHGNGEREVAEAVGAPAPGGRRPDERSASASLIEPVDPIVVTRIFEGLVDG
jgi:hypothetical protein